MWQLGGISAAASTVRVALTIAWLTPTPALGLNLKLEPDKPRYVTPPWITHPTGPCEEAFKPKVAIVMSGVARMIIDEEVYTNFTKNLVDALCWRGLHGDRPDVFMHLRLGDSSKKKQNQRSVFDAMSTRQEDLDAATQIIQPRRLVTEEGEGPYHEKSARKQLGNSSCFQGWWYGVPNHLTRGMNEFYGVQSAYKLLEEEEMKGGEFDPYDLVMFVRPDIHWGYLQEEALYSINGTLKAADRALFHFSGDWFSVVPRRASDEYGYILRDYFLNPSNPACNLTRTEDVLTRHVMKRIENKSINVTPDCCWKSLHVMRPNRELQTYR